MGESTPDFKEILKVLVAHGVEFVVIGGVGAVLHGAPIATFDLDIVHEQNLDRLLTGTQNDQNRFGTPFILNSTDTLRSDANEFVKQS